MNKRILFSAIFVISIFFAQIIFSFEINQETAEKNNFNLSLQNGIELLKKRDFKGAIEEINKFIIADQTNSAAFYNRGLCYMYLNDFELAIHDFTQAIKIDSNVADSYNNRGLCNYYLNEYEKALADLNKAIKLDGKFAEAYLNRASVFINTKDYDKAIKDLSSALKFNPKNPEVFAQRARLYYMTKKNKQAVEDYTQVLKLGNKHYKTYYNRGNAYFKMNKYQEAINDYTEALKTAPNDPEVLNNRSAAYYSMGNLEMAAKDRDALKQLRSQTFPPIDEIKWKTYTDKDSLIFFEMPANWNLTKFDNNGNEELIISPDNVKVNLDGFSVGLTSGVMLDVGQTYPIKTEGDMINFWKGSTQESTKEMHFYSIEFEKQSRLYGHSAVLIKAKMQATPKHVRFDMLEYIVAINDNLFYLYFQAPENSFEYYGQIFMKAIQSVRFDEKAHIFRHIEE